MSDPAVADYSAPNKFTDPEAYEVWENDGDWIPLLSDGHPLKTLLAKRTDLEAYAGEIQSGCPNPGCSPESDWWMSAEAHDWMETVVGDPANVPANMRSIVAALWWSHTQ